MMAQFVPPKHEDTERLIAEQWPAIALETVHDLRSNCRCGLPHEGGHRAQMMAGSPTAVEFGVYVNDDIGEHLITVVGVLKPEPDEWGRAGHGRTVAVVTGYSHVKTIRMNPIPPPDRPKEAIDSIDWTDPTVIVVTRWHIPSRYWSKEYGYSPAAEWEPHVERFTPTGSGNWAAIYWQHFQPYADRMRTKRKAEAFLKYGSDYGDLYVVGIARKGEKR